MTAKGRIKVVLAVAVFTLGAAGCGGETEGRGSGKQSPSAPASLAPEESSPASLSERGVRVAVPSHCGVLSLTVGGRLWLADPPLGAHNPPRGWEENETKGVLLQTGPGSAVFEGDGGQRASFRGAPLGAADPNAGCE